MIIRVGTDFGEQTAVDTGAAVNIRIGKFHIVDIPEQKGVETGFQRVGDKLFQFPSLVRFAIVKRPRMSSKYEVLSSSSQFGQARGIDGAAPLKTGAFGTISDCGSFSSSPFCLNSSSSSDRSWGCSIWIPPICRRSSDQIFLWEAKIKTESCLGEIHGNE